MSTFGVVAFTLWGLDMPLLAAIFLPLYVGLTNFLIAHFSRVVVLKLAIAGMIVAAFLVMHGLLAALVAGLAVVMPVQLAATISFIFPGNTLPCISAVIAADAAVAGFRLYVAGTRA